MRRGKVLPLTAEVRSMFMECGDRLGSNQEAAARMGLSRDGVTRVIRARSKGGVMSTSVEAAQALLIELRLQGVNVGRRGSNQLTRKRWHCRTCDRDLPVAMFNRRRNKRGEMTHRYNCKSCETRGRFKHNGPTGYVPITKVWDTFDEITRRCASQAEAARRLGMTDRALNRILWKAHTQVQARTAEKALILLRELRVENVWLERTHAAKRAEYADEIQCKGCGGDLNNYTADCGTCWERRNGRARRLDPEKVKMMKAADRRSKKKARERRKKPAG